MPHWKSILQIRSHKRTEQIVMGLLQYLRYAKTKLRDLEDIERRDGTTSKDK